MVPAAAGVAGRRADPAADRRPRRQRRHAARRWGSGSRRRAATAEAGAARRRGSRRRCSSAPGLLVQRDDGSVIDRFRNRLMIPICRDTGSVIAFGGRAVDADQQPKYLNSPETPIYSKSRTLYGLNLAKAADPAGQVRRAGRGLFRLRAGVPGRVPGGRRLVRHGADAAAGAAAAAVHRKVVLSFDPDAAGQGATAKSCEMLVAEGFEVNVAMLPAGEDPDTFVRKHGAQGYVERLTPVAAVSGVPARPGGGRPRPEHRRRPRASSWLKCCRSPAGFRMRRCGTGSPTGWPSRRGSPTRWCGPKSARRRSRSRPTLTGTRTAELRAGHQGRKGADLVAGPPAGGGAGGAGRAGPGRFRGAGVAVGAGSRAETERR